MPARSSVAKSGSSGKEALADTGKTPLGSGSRQPSLTRFNQPPAPSTHAAIAVPPGGTATVSDSLPSPARTVRMRSRYPQQERR